MIRIERIKELRYFIYLLAMYLSTLYFSLLAIRGSNFSNEVDTSSYIFYTFIADAIAVIFAISNFKKNSRKFITLLVPLLLIVLYYFEDGITDWMFKSFIAFSIPCCFIGTSMATEGSLHHFSKWFEMISLFVTLSVLSAIPYILFNRTVDFEYQTYSYYCGFVYSVNLFYLFYGNNFDRFKIFRTKLYFLISTVLLIVEGACCLIAGGRGGFLLVIASTVIFFSILKKTKISHVIFFIVATFIVVNLIPKEFIDPILAGSERTFSFLKGGSIDMGATSGRDMVYEKAINLISERPFFGYGIFGYVLYNHATPHNIFLEVMLQGGIFYSILFWSFMIFIFRKMFRMIKADEKNIFLLVLGIWPFVELLFSSSYMMFGLFWFVISYVYVYDEIKILKK